MTRIAGLTGATLRRAPTVCHDCVWWQSRTGSREGDKRRWIEKTEDEWGAWGTVYYDDDGRLLGSMQYGPAALFPRAAELPAGPPSRRRGARHVRLPRRRARARGCCSRSSSPRSARRATRARRRSRRSPTATRRASPRTSASSSTGRSSRATSSPTSASRRCASQGRVELARLELGGLVPVVEGKRERVLRVVREAFFPPRHLSGRRSP